MTGDRTEDRTASGGGRKQSSAMAANGKRVCDDVSLHYRFGPILGQLPDGVTIRR